MKKIRNLLVVAGLLVVMAIVGLAGLGLALKIRSEAPGPLAVESVLVVPEGAGVRSVAHILSRQNLLRDPMLFVWIARLTHADRNLQAGEYRVPPRASIRQLLEILQSGQVILHRLTVPEGLTSLAVVEMLRQESDLTGTIDQVPPEGSLLPETYYYVRGRNRNVIIERMQQAMTSLLDRLWPLRAENLPFSTPEEAVILASIVEKETGLPNERPHVAGVYINRLDRHMALQADPTVSYGLGGGMFLHRALTYEDLRKKTPFNTYRIKGLPPSPIANPGADAIAAVLNPLETDDLYFVADGTGGHVFAPTLKQHNRNVAKWRRYQRDQAYK